jgi:hypothetical protein
VLLGWGAVAAAPAYSADRQQRFVIEHVTDVSSGKAWWSVLNDGASLPSSYRAIGTWKRGKLPFSDRSRWMVPATADRSSKAPDVRIVSEVQSGNERTLTLRLAANGLERVALIGTQDSKIRSAGVDGFVRPIDQTENGNYVIDCFGRSCDGATIQFTTRHPKPLKFLVVGSRAAIPPSSAPLIEGRPRFARPQYNRDESIVFKRVSL